MKHSPEMAEFVDDLVESHWNYIKAVLTSLDVPKKDINKTSVIYKTTARHFFKHGVEYNTGIDFSSK